MSQLPLEIEAKLVIASDRPREIAAAIGRLHSVGPWLLQERRPMKVRDTYFDLDGDELGSLGIALRLRWTADDCLITVKGPESRVAGIIQRQELEQRWTSAALEEVLRFIASHGLRLTIPVRTSSHDSPEHVMKALGLVPVQDRMTDRVRREVLSAEAEGSGWAELAVDEVEYHVGSRKLRHYEVEIELERTNDVEKLGAIRDELQRQWKELCPWSHSKFATGRAIADLLNYMDSEDLTANGILRAGAYRAIERLLRQG